MPQKPPIINCHTHIFTGDHVPPYLARTFVPRPVAWFISMTRVIQLVRWYNKQIKPFKYSSWYKNWLQDWYRIEIWLKRMWVIGTIKVLLDIYLFVLITFYFGRALMDFDTTYSNLFLEGLRKVFKWLENSGTMLEVKSVWAQIGLFILIIIVFKSVRNMLKGLLKQFKVLPGKDFVSLFNRYLQIGEFAKYKTQSGIYHRLKKQYPENTQFVVLPMDMEYMKAGAFAGDYYTQMQDLIDIKEKDSNNHFFPFMFAHPERMQDKAYFNYSLDANGKVVLDENCKVAQYFKAGIAGIKIYPALGYYPFDHRLLVLWKYAADHGIPVMTHCIRGTIFYRGTKKPKWDQHPVFTEGKINRVEKTKCDDNTVTAYDIDLDADYVEAQKDTPLYLNEVKNIDFCNNFSHPMNYLCLLDNTLLYKVINELNDFGPTKTKKAQQEKEAYRQELRKVFHCDDDAKTVKDGKGLSDLKLCFAHFGGEDQWNKFLEADRDNYTSQLVLLPNNGIHFLTDKNGNPKPGKPAFIWNHVDWYSIICSLMLQYPNVYADISYILHDDFILPLLKQTLTNPKLKKRVLYGSDFYVVRNHNSDKDLLANMRAGLSEEEFDQIARDNPRDYLNLGAYSPHDFYGIPS
ncbi:amidohydrolase family protein [Winogradskyella wandonensis]|uniref:Amidohydrolase family protein n=1 Tax=Winogradskyella wandonensis TaxID=1442586 RepID=A0A4R1KSI1_9FLAO|nr:amidohydrolase family protein [Winogradskyella wandonensis]TCK67984.1 amidohydrolase family protein [Winogradskyella wandonensis]